MEYAIYESSTGNYVQADGSLDTSAVWQTISSWGAETVTGLSSPVAQYSFQTKSRNTSDPLDASTSESDLSSSISISNTAPSISIDSVAQQTGGVNYVLVNYTGTDIQNDTNSLTTYQYSQNGSDWFTMTEKGGVGSSGTSTLLFTSGGGSFVFAWDVATDLPGVEDSTVYVRIQSSDTLASSNLAKSSAFAVDNAGPVISNFAISQTPGTNNVVIEYDLTDNTGSDNIVEINISEDSGSTWAVDTTTVSGDVGLGIIAGVDRIITWDAGTDFDNEEQSDMRVQVRATDSYGNVGSFVSSSDFTIDTANPVVSNVSAEQSAGSSDVVVTYDLTDGSPAGHLVEIGISEDGGSTWTVTSTSVTGQVGSGQATGSKTLTWDAGTDFTNEDQNDMRVRIRSLDYYGNQGSYVESVNFAIDTTDPIINNIFALQTVGSNDVVFTYDLSDTNASGLSVEIDISDDGGSTWNITDTASTGDLGDSISAGINKTITWPAGIDFDNEEQTDMRVRLRAIDSFGNTSNYFSSNDFNLDTGYPLGLLSFSKFSSTDTAVTLNWSGGVSDSNFDHYEIWYGTNLDDVENKTGTAVKWDDGDDANLNNINTISTVITPISEGNYYAKIWAIDTFGNEISLNNISFVIGEDVVEPEIEPPASSGGGLVVYQDTSAPSKPVLTSLESPTRNFKFTISGLAEPRTKIDLYNNGEFLERLDSTTNNNGVFSQDFIFEEGVYNLSVRAVDFANNTSVFSNPIRLIIDRTSPEAPIILLPTENEVVSGESIEIIGISEPFSNISILVDNINLFETSADVDGAWNFIVPNNVDLGEGKHNFAINAIDYAGNVGEKAVLDILKTAEEVALEEREGGGVTPSIPLPAEAEILEIVEATELPGVPIPEILKTNVTVQNNIISFSGKALPNKEVVVYIHSDQALIYKTKTDDQGNWLINHSQDIVELSPGEHSIFAVTVDTGAKVKSRPSEVKIFDVEKSWSVALFNVLNLQTTLLTLIIVFITIFWLYRLRKRTLTGNIY